MASEARRRVKAGGVWARRLGVLLCLGLLLGTSRSADATELARSGNSASGWSTWDNGSEQVQFKDGALYSKDGKGHATWYFEAPPAFNSAAARAYGGSLRYELRQGRDNSQFDHPDVILVGPKLTLVIDAGTNPKTTWTPYRVVLHECAGWTVVGEDRRPTAHEFQETLRTLKALRIRGEYRVGDDECWLRSVVLSTGKESGPAGRAIRLFHPLGQGPGSGQRGQPAPAFKLLEPHPIDVEPKFLAAPAQAEVKRKKGERVLISRDPQGHAGVNVDNCLTLLLQQGRQRIGLCAGYTQAIAWDGTRLQQLGKDMFSLPVLDLTRYFPLGKTVKLSAAVLDHGGDASLSDVFLVVEPRSPCDTEDPTGSLPKPLAAGEFALLRVRSETGRPFRRRVRAYVSLIEQELKAVQQRVTLKTAEQVDVERRLEQTRKKALELWRESRTKFRQASHKIRTKIRAIEAERWKADPSLETWKINHDTYVEELAKLTAKLLAKPPPSNAAVLWKQRDRLIKDIATVAKRLGPPPDPKEPRIAKLKRELTALETSSLRKTLDEAAKKGFDQAHALRTQHDQLGNEVAFARASEARLQTMLQLLRDQMGDAEGGQDVRPALFGMRATVGEKVVAEVHGGVRKETIHALEHTVRELRSALTHAEKDVPDLKRLEQSALQSRNLQVWRAEDAHWRLVDAVEDLGDGLKSIAVKRFLAQIGLSGLRVGASGLVGGSFHAALADALNMAVFEGYHRFVKGDGPAGWRRFNEAPLWTQYDELEKSQSKELREYKLTLDSLDPLKDLKNTEQAAKLVASATFGGTSEEVMYRILRRKLSDPTAARDVASHVFRSTSEVRDAAMREMFNAIDDVASLRARGAARGFIELALSRASSASAKLTEQAAARATARAALDVAERQLTHVSQRIAEKSWRRTATKAGGSLVKGVAVSLVFDAIDSAVNTHLQGEERALWNEYFDASLEVRFKILVLRDRTRIWVRRKNDRLRAEIERDLLNSLYVQAQDMLARYRLGRPGRTRFLHTSKFKSSEAPLKIVVNTWAATHGVELSLSGTSGSVKLEAKPAAPQVPAKRIREVRQHVDATKTTTTWHALVSKEALEQLGAGALTLQVTWR